VTVHTNCGWLYIRIVGDCTHELWVTVHTNCGWLYKPTVGDCKYELWVTVHTNCGWLYKRTVGDCKYELWVTVYIRIMGDCKYELWVIVHTNPQRTGNYCAWLQILSGRDMTHASVARLNVEAQDRYQPSPRGICVVQSATGTGLPRVLRFSQFSITPIQYHSSNTNYFVYYWSSVILAISIFVK
jgi:rubredoxin